MADEAVRSEPVTAEGKSLLAGKMQGTVEIGGQGGRKKVDFTRGSDQYPK